MSETLAVHLVDDDAGVAEACRYLLEGLGLAVIDWRSGEDFLAGANLDEPAAVLLDMRLPGIDGRAVHERLRAADACLGVIILTGHGDIDMAVESMKRGAVDFLQKPVGSRAMERALDSAFARARQCAGDRRIRELAATLSEREREIARWVSEGLTNREIAEALHIAIRTVEVHRSRVVEKMGAANSAELAAIWQRLEA
ncbi:response regulator [Spiribacter sp. 1M153]|uniref:response regulator n=1 Tax=Spiribacter roseus TaxID=1855875 RepID=UPI00349FA1A6